MNYDEESYSKCCLLKLCHAFSLVVWANRVWQDCVSPVNDWLCEKVWLNHFQPEYIITVANTKPCSTTILKFTLKKVYLSLMIKLWMVEKLCHWLLRWLWLGKMLIQSSCGICCGKNWRNWKVFVVCSILICNESEWTINNKLVRGLAVEHE